MRIKGKVVGGKRLGRTIGFPTANLQADGAAAARRGVYAAWFLVNGERLPCMVNIGRHPTLPEGEPTIEAHIFDFSGDIYGMDAEIELVEFLRSEEKFPSVEALRAQLARDTKSARAILKT